MSNTKLPYVPPELAEALDKRFPHRCIKKTSTKDELMWQGGTREVIDLLLRTVETQTAKNINPH